MKVRFLKAWGKFTISHVGLVNDNWGNKAIASGIVELADKSDEVTELPLPEGKGKTDPTGDPKKKPISKRKPKSDTQSK